VQVRGRRAAVVVRGATRPRDDRAWVVLAAVVLAAVALAGVRFWGVARVFEPPRAEGVPRPRPAWEVRPAMVTP
jgi:hypothetical protein